MSLFKKKKPAPDPAQDASSITTLAQAAMRPQPLPNETDPNLIDAVTAEDKLARKRKGRASTMITTTAGMPATQVKTLAGGPY